jgi:threonine synthase
MLEEDTSKAYGSQFTNQIAPVVSLDEHLSLLELWHGPTCAFKDMALQIMPRLLSRALNITKEKRKALILVATSGDTGKAALEGYKDVDQTAIQVFYPENGVSEAQKRQMQTQEGLNVNVTAIKGNFDHAQSGVKKIFSDPDFAKKLDEKGIFLSSANSINWGRLVPQIVYYISAYCDMIISGKLVAGETVNICVPTGNFGNILAAYLAKKMGLPLGKLICASNDNHVLTDFLASGTYDKNRPFHMTVSPSMDILISSNLERLLYLETGHSRCAELMRQLNETGKYTVDQDTLQKIQSHFEGDWCSEKDCLSEIAEVYQKYHYLADTHTAVALHCAKNYQKRHPESQILVVSTASPYKFAPAVCKALGLSDSGTTLELFNRLSEFTHTEIPKPLADVLKKETRFNTTIEAGRMSDAVLTFTDSLV